MYRSFAHYVTSIFIAGHFGDCAMFITRKSNGLIVVVQGKHVSSSFLVDIVMEEFAAALANIRLTLDNVPGASLGTHPDRTPRKPNELCIPDLRRWLACRGARQSGNKAELVEGYSYRVVNICCHLN